MCSCALSCIASVLHIQHMLRSFKAPARSIRWVVAHVCSTPVAHKGSLWAEAAALSPAKQEGLDATAASLP